MREPIIKEYKDFTREEKNKSQEIWVKHLNKFCPEDLDTGNRPCDNGCLCDQCHYDWGLQHEYAEDLVEQGIPVTHNQVRYVSKED